MTDLKPDPETVTTPIAQRHYTPAVYDVNATAILRRDEYPILDLRPTGEMPRVLADPDTSGEIVPLMHLMQTAYGTAPTVPPPLPPRPAPKPGFEAWMRPGRTPEYFSPERPRGKTGGHRMAWPRWADQLIGAGVATAAWSVLGLAVLAVIR